jgi:general stress protein YciG
MDQAIDDIWVQLGWVGQAPLEITLQMGCANGGARHHDPNTTLDAGRKGYGNTSVQTTIKKGKVHTFANASQCPCKLYS